MTDSIPPQLTIDPNSHEHKYLQLQHQIEALIEQGTWQQHHRLPSETALAEKLGISVMTVRQAMTGLVSKGLIVRLKGRGTFVLPYWVHLFPNTLRGFSEDLRGRHAVPTARILAFGLITPSSTVCEHLYLTGSEQVLFIRRLRLRDGEPVVIQNAYLTFTDLTQDELEATGSLYTLLEQKGVTLTEADETLSAITADEELARLLNVEPGAALLCMTRVTLDDHKRPVEFVISQGRGDIYAYSLRVQRVTL